MASIQRPIQLIGKLKCSCKSWCILARISSLQTFDTAAGFFLIDEFVLSNDMKSYIEPCTGVTMRCTLNIKVQPFRQIRPYVRLQDIVVPCYFIDIRNLSPMIFIGTTFCDSHIFSIKQTLHQITQKNSRSLLILAFDDGTISATYSPQNLRLNKLEKNTLNPSSQPQRLSYRLPNT